MQSDPRHAVAPPELRAKILKALESERADQLGARIGVSRGTVERCAGGLKMKPQTLAFVSLALGQDDENDDE